MSGGHGAWLPAMAGAFWRARTTPWARDSAARVEEARVSTLEGADVRHGGRRTWQWRWGTEPCMAATHRAHVALWSISPSAWRATVRPVWKAILGQLWAELDLGPRSKVEAHLMIYKTH